MSFHELLERQMNRHLTPDIIDNPLFKSFIEAVNGSYISNETESNLMKPAVQKSKSEHWEISKSFEKADMLKKDFTDHQSKSLELLHDSYKEAKEEGRTDLNFISKYLNKQFSVNKESEDLHLRTVGLLNTLMANHQSGVLVEDENGKILYANQAFCDMFNITADPETIIGEDFSNSAPGLGNLFKEIQSISPRINDIIANRKIVSGELFETADHRFLEIEYIPIIIDDQYKGHLWKYSDATLRIKTKVLLEQSEERNRLIMNAALNAIINIDSKGKITFWNSQAEIIFGWKQEEVLGKVLTKTIIVNQYIKEHENRIAHFLKTGSGSLVNKHIELLGFGKNGREFPIEISITPIIQGEETFYCTYIKDISERIKAESNLKFQEEKYRNIITNINLGLIEIDNNDIIQFANQSFSDMSGFALNDIVGKTPTATFLNAENAGLIQSKKELRKQGISDMYQIQVKNKKGDLRWWTISGGPNYDDKGSLVGSVGIHLDITDQKKLEEALENEKIKAEEASKAKEAFLANMSHEIRTPLNAIIGFLRELNKQEVTALQKKYIQNCNIASKHLLAIINNVLDISKIEAGEMSLENEDFIFDDIINNVITVLLPLAKQKGLRLLSGTSNKTYQVFKGDTLRLEQILFNLVGNALKFTQQGSVSINCEVLKDSAVFQEVEISISDTGIGMSKTFMENIFKKFSQEDKAVTRKFGGTGLGMAITKELIHLMKGTIHIESQKNKGTTIRIKINLQKGDLNRLNNSNEEEINSRIDGISILMVEDNEMNRMVAQNSLQYYNCKVTEAENGLDAIELLKTQKFDVILMDIQMPEMDGIEATKIIRKDLKLTTPIIALTANAFKTEIEYCKKAGMDDYITKPFDETILIETIARHTVNKAASIVNKKKAEERIYNLNSITILSRGNHDFVIKMINIFLFQATDTVEKMEKAISSNDFHEVGRLIHKIRPSVEGMGVLSIMGELKLIEKVCKEAVENDLISTLFSKIKSTLLLAVIQLNKYELKK